MINRISSWKCRLATADQENDVRFNKPLTNDLIFSSCGELSLPRLFFSYVEKRNPDTHTHTHTYTQRPTCILNIVFTNKLGLDPWSRCRQSGSEGQSARFFLLGFGELTQPSAVGDSELSWAPNVQKQLCLNQTEALILRPPSDLILLGRWLFLHHSVRNLSAYKMFLCVPYSNEAKVSVVSDSTTPWTMPSVAFSRPEYWSG